MILLVPYQIETLQDTKPWTNWLIIGACVVMHFALALGEVDESTAVSLVLDGFSFPGLVSYMFLHVDLMHLIGNMVFLWVFGNAICSNTNNLVYPLLFLGLGVGAAVIHNIFDGSPAIGASGAINGITGIVFAMYPLNRVYLFWIFLVRGGTMSCKAWVIIVAWFCFDIFGAVTGGGGIAYWAHIGGFLLGVGVGLLLLQLGVIRVTEYDNRTLLEILKGEQVER